MTHNFSHKDPLNIVAALVKKLDFQPLFCSFISTITGFFFFFFLSKATVSSCRQYLPEGYFSRLTRKCTEIMALTFLDQINGIMLTPSSVQITLNLFRMIGKQLLSDHLSWTVAQGFKCNLQSQNTKLSKENRSQQNQTHRQNTLVFIVHMSACVHIQELVEARNGHQSFFSLIALTLFI